MHKPLVSIVIPVYNGANYLAEAIDSALAQDEPSKEIIVVNDGSTDDGATAAVARGYGDRIRYFEKPNGGVSTALNMGIREMRGTYFSWLSHDDFYLPGKLRHQLALIEASGNPEQIVSGGYVIVSEDRRPISLMDFYRLYPKEKLETPLFPVLHCAVNGCAMLIHKNHFERVGLFDENLRTTQDYDLWFRMLRGQRLMYAREIDVASRAFEGQTSQRLRTTHEQECEGLWLGMFEELTREERVQIGGSEEKFYADMYDHFDKYTSYPGVAACLKARCTDEAFSWRYPAGLGTKIEAKVRMLGMQGKLRR